MRWVTAKPEAISIFATEVRKADNGADQQKEHDELQILEQKGSHEVTLFHGCPSGFRER